MIYNFCDFSGGPPISQSESMQPLVLTSLCIPDLFSYTVVPQDTSALTYELFEIRAVKRAKFCFEIRATFEIQGTAS